MKVLALHLKNFVDYAKVRGLTRLDLTKLDEILPENWHAEQAMITQEEFYQGIHFLYNVMKDPLAGIKAGNFMALKLLGLIYQISLQTNSVEEAFYYLQSFLKTTFPIIEAETEICGELACVKLKIQNDQTGLNRIVLENVLTIISREVKVMAGSGLKISLSSPFFNADYPAGWGYRPEFSVDFEAIILKSSLKEVHQLHLEVLIPEYLKMLGQLQATERFSDKVRITMLAMSNPALPDIEAICQVLYLTPRTLQRRLLKEDTTFRQISQDLKKQICALLILHKPYPVSSLSYILGYSEPASFIHSFKKWYGDSPRQFRRTLAMRP